MAAQEKGGYVSIKRRVKHYRTKPRLEGIHDKNNQAGTTEMEIDHRIRFKVESLLSTPMYEISVLLRRNVKFCCYIIKLGISLVN